jgi:hypothetical protein
MASPTNDKTEIINGIKKYLKEYKAVDLRVFLFDHWGNRSQLNSEFVSEIANLLRQTNEYEITQEGGGLLTTYIIRPTIRKKFNERNPLLFALIVSLFGAVFALSGKWLIEIKGNREQNQQDIDQDLHLKQLSDSLNVLQKKADNSIR